MLAMSLLANIFTLYNTEGQKGFSNYYFVIDDKVIHYRLLWNLQFLKILHANKFQ